MLWFCKTNLTSVSLHSFTFCEQYWYINIFVLPNYKKFSDSSRSPSCHLFLLCFSHQSYCIWCYQGWMEFWYKRGKLVQCSFLGFEANKPNLDKQDILFYPMLDWTGSCYSVVHNVLHTQTLREGAGIKSLGVNYQCSWLYCLYWRHSNWY